MSEEAWAIENAVADFFGTVIARGATILEFGSGHGTLKLLKNYNVISIEDNPEWLGFATNKNESEFESVYIHAPLIEIDPVEGLGHKTWYDESALSRVLSIEFDAVLIDGPLGKYGRGGVIGFIQENISLFSEKPIVIDDCDRLDELKLLLRLHEIVGGRADIFEGKRKFGVITKSSQ